MSSKDFQILSKLGEGSYSSVWKVKRLSDGQEYAMKKVKLSALNEKERENALNEVRILASIKSPYIIGYKEAFFEDNSMTLCIVMEYAAGGDLYNKIVQHTKNKTYFKEEEIWSCLINMALALKTLHEMKILHRDLKCANVFISKDGKECKLGDLNVSKIAKNNLAHTQTGTPYYASPEVWRDQPYDAKSDIWSLGCVLYEMAALKPPFRANDMQGLFKKVQRGVFDRIPSQYSIDLYNVISMCLQVSPIQRPSCDQLLKHHIVRKHGRDLLGDLPEEAADPAGNELLGTIKLPKNMKALGQNLPKPNYNNVAQSVEVEKGGLSKIPEYERNISSSNGKRPISQAAPVTSNIIRGPAPQSRESKIAAMQKLPVSSSNKESEKEYLARIQREFIDNAKSIKPTELVNKKSPVKDVIKEAERPPSYKALPVKKTEENVKRAEPLNARPEQKKYDYQNQRPDPYKALQSPNLYPVRQSNSRGSPAYESKEVRPLLSREQNRPVVSSQGSRDVLKQQPQIYNNKQEYIINKYQQDVHKVIAQEKPEEKRNYQRVYSDNNNILSKRAEYVLQKYQPVPSSHEVSKLTPLNQRKEIDSLLNNYNNIYNIKQQYDQVNYGKVQHSPYQKVDNLYQKSPNLGVQHKNVFANENHQIYQYNNANHIRNNQQMQQRGVTRPVWWG